MVNDASGTGFTMAFAEKVPQICSRLRPLRDR
jgi:hypothetical protein